MLIENSKKKKEFGWQFGERVFSVEMFDQVDLTLELNDCRGFVYGTFCK